jgi:hypothetical protein
MSLKPIQRSAEFTEILGIIQAGRAKAFEAVNVALIETYWSIGEQLSRKVTEADWGKGIVKELADWLAKQARPTWSCQNSQHCCENCPGQSTCSCSPNANRQRKRNSICYRRLAVAEPLKGLRRKKTPWPLFRPAKKGQQLSYRYAMAGLTGGTATLLGALGGFCYLVTRGAGH